MTIDRIDVYIDWGDDLTIRGSGFHPFEPVQVYIDLEGGPDPNLGFATANGSGAFGLVLEAPLSGIPGIYRTLDTLLSLDAVTVMARGADGSLASAPARIADTRFYHWHPPPPPPIVDASLFASCVIIGEKATVWGSGSKPGEEMRIFLVTGSRADGAPVQSLVGSSVANSRGAFQATIEIEKSIGDSDIEPGLFALKSVGIRGTEATAPLMVISEHESDSCNPDRFPSLAISMSKPPEGFGFESFGTGNHRMCGTPEDCSVSCRIGTGLASA